MFLSFQLLKLKFGIVLFQVIGSVNSWGVDVFRVAELVNDDRALTCITYKIFQVRLSFVCY